jgi:hypothetical protein
MGQASLKRTFRRGVDEKLVRKWEGVVQLASTVVFTREEGRIIWQYNSFGIKIEKFDKQYYMI